jgi:O-antigen/teichoic acid export membrane protein
MPIANQLRDLLSGAVLLSVGQVAGYGLSFTRNLILARLLTKADFGLAAALSMAISLLELVGQMAFGKQMVQALEGEEPRFQAAAHALQLGVGLVSAVMVIAGSYPLAATFKVPDLTWAFASLAVIPLARGVMHLDLARFQRRYAFGPVVFCETVPQGLATAAAWPLAMWLADFRAVLVIMLGKEFLTLALSHILAKRPYRCEWQLHYAKQMLTFGWPLLLTGLVFFASQQGDQMLIGAAFPLADLGTYSIAFTISSLPFFIFGQIGSSLMLPILSRHQTNAVLFERHYRRCLELSTVGALLILCPLIIVGGDLVRLFYGAKYSGAGTLMAIFGSLVALRFFRWAPAVAAMSRADTKNHLISNIARACSFPLAALVIALGNPSLAEVASCGLAGEALAIMTSVLMVRRQQGIGLAVHARPILFLMGWITLGLALQQWIAEGAPVWQGAGAVVALWSIGVVVALLIFPGLVALYRQAVSDLRLPVLAVRK